MVPSPEPAFKRDPNKSGFPDPCSTPIIVLRYPKTFFTLAQNCDIEHHILTINAQYPDQIVL